MKTKALKTMNLHFEENDSYFVREAYNALRANLLFCGASVKTIVVTSCLANEGKTTVTMELAKNLAEAGRKVLFVDADLRKSVAVNRYSDQPGVNGLSMVLSGLVKTEDAIVATQVPGLHVLFSGPFPPNPTELLSGKEFAGLLEELKPNYDVILIDSSPLGMVVDSAVIAGYCDGALLVIHQGAIKTRMAKNVVEQLRRSGCRILGAVFNHPTRSRRSSGAKYGQYYYRYESEEKAGTPEKKE